MNEPQIATPSTPAAPVAAPPANDAAVAAAVANPSVLPTAPEPKVPDTTDDFVAEFVNQYGDAFRAQQKASATTPEDTWGDDSGAALLAPPTAEELFARSQSAAPARDEHGRFVKQDVAAPAAASAPAPVADAAPAAPTPQNPFQMYGLNEQAALDAVSLYNQREAIRKSFEAVQAQAEAAQREAQEARQAAEIAEVQRQALLRLRAEDPAAFETYINSPAFNQPVAPQQPQAPQQKQYTEEDISRIVENRLSDRFQQMQTEQATRAFFDTAQNSIYNGFDEKKYHPFAAKLLRTITASQLEMDRLQKRVNPTGPIDDTRRVIESYLSSNAREFDQMIEAEVQRRIQVKQQPSAKVAPVPDRGVTAMPHPSKSFEEFIASDNDEFAGHLANMWRTMNAGAQ